MYYNTCHWVNLKNTKKYELDIHNPHTQMHTLIRPPMTPYIHTPLTHTTIPNDPHTQTFTLSAMRNK